MSEWVSITMSLSAQTGTPAKFYAKAEFAHFIVHPRSSKFVPLPPTLFETTSFIRGGVSEGPHTGELLRGIEVRGGPGALDIYW